MAPPTHPPQPPLTFLHIENHIYKHVSHRNCSKHTLWFAFFSLSFSHSCPLVACTSSVVDLFVNDTVHPTTTHVHSPAPPVLFLLPARIPTGIFCQGGTRGACMPIFQTVNVLVPSNGFVSTHARVIRSLVNLICNAMYNGLAKLGVCCLSLSLLDNARHLISNQKRRFLVFH